MDLVRRAGCIKMPDMKKRRIPRDPALLGACARRLRMACRRGRRRQAGSDYLTVMRGSLAAVMVPAVRTSVMASPAISLPSIGPTSTLPLVKAV